MIFARNTALRFGQLFLLGIGAAHRQVGKRRSA